MAEIRPLRRLLDPRRPLTYGIVQAGENVPGGVPYIRPVDMTPSAGVADPDSLLRTSPEIAAQYRRSEVHEGDLVLSIGPSYGKVMIVPKVLSGSNLTQGTARLALSERVDRRWAYWFLQSQIARDHWNISVAGGTFAALNLGPLGETPVHVWPIEEQRRIADFLDDRVARIDKIIAARKVQSALVDTSLLELIRGMTVGESAGGSPTEIVWMPWIGRDRRLWKISTAFKTGSGTTPKSGDSRFYDGIHPWVNTGDLRDGVITNVAQSVTDAALTAYTSLAIYPPGTLLIAMYGATIGRLGVLGTEACVNQACCALVELGPVQTEYAYYWLLAHRDAIIGLAAGGGQPNISQDIVRSLRIPAPPPTGQAAVITEARRIAGAAASVKADIGASIDRFEELRRSLITAAVTGQFDVSSADADGSRVLV